MFAPLEPLSSARKRGRFDAAAVRRRILSLLVAWGSKSLLLTLSVPTLFNFGVFWFCTSRNFQDLFLCATQRMQVIVY